VLSFVIYEQYIEHNINILAQKLFLLYRRHLILEEVILYIIYDYILRSYAGKTRNTCIILVRKSAVRQKLGGARQRQKDNTKI
jgi:hypothetical protein